jgi:ankyrin repeat protein
MKWSVQSGGDKYGMTPLCQAAENGHRAVVKLLIEASAELEAKDDIGRTLLSWAKSRSRRARF